METRLKHNAIKFSKFSNFDYILWLIDFPPFSFFLKQVIWKILLFITNKWLNNKKQLMHTFLIAWKLTRSLLHGNLRDLHGIYQFCNISLSGMMYNHHFWTISLSGILMYELKMEKNNIFNAWDFQWRDVMFIRNFQ